MVFSLVFFLVFADARDGLRSTALQVGSIQVGVAVVQRFQKCTGLFAGQRDRVAAEVLRWREAATSIKLGHFFSERRLTHFNRLLAGETTARTAH
ncbi:MAG: hypothetical protein ABI905_18510 [Betaproteobacteria bacterium]